MADDLVRTDADGARILTEMIRWWRRTGGVRDDERPTIPVIGPPVVYHRGLAKADIKSGTASTGGKVHYLRLNSTGAWEEDTGSTHTAYDPFEYGAGASSGEQVYLYRHAQSGKLHLFAVPSQRCQGYVTNTASTNGTATATFKVQSISPLWGVSPTTGPCEKLTVKNPFTWAIYPNALCRFERMNNGDWSAYQIACTGATATTCST